MNQNLAYALAVILGFGGVAILWGHSDSAAVDAAGTRTAWLIAGWVLVVAAASFFFYAAKGNSFKQHDD